METAFICIAQGMRLAALPPGIGMTGLTGALSEVRKES